MAVEKINAHGFPKPVIEVDLGPDGVPLGATAVARVAATPAQLWKYIFAVENYPGMIPMISRVARNGDRVTVHLKFKISLFSVGFDFTADATFEDQRWLELRWVAGEPRELRIRFDLDDCGNGSCEVRAGIWFDVFSLGWVAKYFLRHHPEIQFGILPGSALTIVESLRRLAESPRRV
jgi:ribosome-associated toxin RatA of RatAB toxin-antitoxin module